MHISETAGAAHPADGLLVMAKEESGLQALEDETLVSLREAVAIDAVGEGAAAGQHDVTRQLRIEIVGVHQANVAQPRLHSCHCLRLDVRVHGLAADHRAPAREAPGAGVAIGGQAEPDDAG
jgi:hypothetical protein